MPASTKTHAMKPTRVSVRSHRTRGLLVAAIAAVLGISLLPSTADAGIPLFQVGGGGGGPAVALGAVYYPGAPGYNASDWSSIEGDGSLETGGTTELAILNICDPGDPADLPGSVDPDGPGCYTTSGGMDWWSTDYLDCTSSSSPNATYCGTDGGWAWLQGWRDLISTLENDGITPLIYTSEAYANNGGSVVAWNSGLALTNFESGTSRCSYLGDCNFFVDQMSVEYGTSTCPDEQDIGGTGSSAMCPETYNEDLFKYLTETDGAESVEFNPGYWSCYSGNSGSSCDGSYWRGEAELNAISAAANGADPLVDIFEEGPQINSDTSDTYNLWECDAQDTATACGAASGAAGSAYEAVPNWVDGADEPAAYFGITLYGTGSNGTGNNSIGQDVTDVSDDANISFMYDTTESNGYTSLSTTDYGNLNSDLAAL